MAEKSDIIDAIEALAVHCRPPLMSTDLRELWMRDWCADLGAFPTEAIQSACRAYRHSGATKFPTAGQLLPMVRAGVPQPPAAERINDPWRPLSDDEFNALSLREKIRHHGIMAMEARRKAGPMWKNTGTPGMGRARDCRVAAEDMPATWRHWTAQADGHEAEATRLRSFLYRQPLRAAE